MNSLFIRKDDQVIVLSGKDKGKKGKVLQTFPGENKVLVEGVNIAHKHQKARRQTDVGGIITKEIPIYAPKVMRVCPKCHQPTRAAFFTSEDGTKNRVCKKCGEAI
ncbi:MAG: 50S ribosomal protein L24 [Oscillospiraceae bacterium]|jgi:large subunit ribosomal protein L24|nr:50S ribosomal protein L24 [Oscillospiraceae bacterium]